MIASSGVCTQKSSIQTLMMECKVDPSDDDDEILIMTWWLHRPFDDDDLESSPVPDDENDEKEVTLSLTQG